MEKYIIDEIYADGYERFAVVESINTNKKFIVHVLEGDEYIEYGGVSQKRKVGDVIEGEIYIWSVMKDKKVDEDIAHEQLISKSPHIKAVVQVAEVIDNFSAYVRTSILDNNVLVRFMHDVNYVKGDKIYIEGSLEMDV